jgi:class 3 adenylate cyclase
MASTRRLAAILAADVAGFTSLIEADLGGTLRALKAIRRDLVDPTIEAHNGRLLKTSGDLLLESRLRQLLSGRTRNEAQGGFILWLNGVRQDLLPGVQNYRLYCDG